MRGTVDRTFSFYMRGCGMGPACSSTWLQGGTVDLAFDCPRYTLGAADLPSDGA
jgi:hypothetical protein